MSGKKNKKELNRTTARNALANNRNLCPFCHKLFVVLFYGTIYSMYLRIVPRIVLKPPQKTWFFQRFRHYSRYYSRYYSVPQKFVVWRFFHGLRGWRLQYIKNMSHWDASKCIGDPYVETIASLSNLIPPIFFGPLDLLYHSLTYAPCQIFGTRDKRKSKSSICITLYHTIARETLWCVRGRAPVWWWLAISSNFYSM